MHSDAAERPVGGGQCEDICTRLLAVVCDCLRDNADVLNLYDSVCGDGDCR